MLITVTAAAATITYLVFGPDAVSKSLIHDIGNQSTWLTMI